MDELSIGRIIKYVLNKDNIGRAGFQRRSYGWTSSTQLPEIRSPWFRAKDEHIEVIKLVELHLLRLQLNLQELNGRELFELYLHILNVWQFEIRKSSNIERNTLSFIEQIKKCPI